MNASLHSHIYLIWVEGCIHPKHLIFFSETRVRQSEENVLKVVLSWVMSWLKTFEILFHVCSSQTNPRIDLKDFFFLLSPVTYGQLHIHWDFEEKSFGFIQYFLLRVNFKNLIIKFFVLYLLNYYVKFCLNTTKI